MTTAPAVPATGAAVRAAVIDRAGATPRVGSTTLAVRRPGHSLVEVVAAPLNPLDLLIASGTFHSVRHDRPYVPGSECVGIVLESDSHAAGTWVYGECHPTPDAPGAFATHTLIDDHDLLVLPAGVDPVTAAAVGNSGTAAYLPLVEVAGLRSGETVLLLGATGAVGQLAVQIARRRGAGRVVGVGRDPRALDRLLGLGADAVVALRADEDADELAGRLASATGSADIVLDGVYGRPLEAALRVCGPRARIVNIGNLAGATAEVPAGLLRGKQLTISGFAGLHTPLQDKHAGLQWLWAALSGGQLQLDVNTFSLDELPQAWQAQAASPHAKCVVVHAAGEHPRTTPGSAPAAANHGRGA